MKRIFAVCAAVFILFIQAMGVSAAQAEDPSVDSYKAFENLLGGWVSQGLEMYPDYVGGVYFDEDNNVIVALSHDTQANRNDVLSLSQNPDVIKFVSVKYSYGELQDALTKINNDSGNYTFLVNFANIAEEQNVIEISVGVSDFPAASSYFDSLYGDKVSVSTDYLIVSDTDYDDSTSGGRAEKIAATKELRRYISIGIIAVLIIIVVVTTLLSANKKTAAKRRYRK